MRGPFDIDARLGHIALHQLGLVTVAQASAHGIDRSALHRRRAAGLWVQVFPGVCRDASMRPSAQQYTLAAALAVPGSVIAGPSAALIHAMPLGSDLARPVVAVSRQRSGRVSGIDTIRLTTALPTRPWHGAGLTTAAATLVLLPRFVGADTLERCLDHCLAKQLTSADAVRRALDALPVNAVAGRKLLLRMLDARTDGIGHRSGTEIEVARWLDAAGLTGWQRNVRIVVAGGAPECDFVWRDDRVVLEVSPFVTHGSREAQARDVARRGLLVAAGWRVVEAIDADLVDRAAFGNCAQRLRLLLGKQRSVA